MYCFSNSGAKVLLFLCNSVANIKCILKNPFTEEAGVSPADGSGQTDCTAKVRKMAKKGDKIAVDTHFIIIVIALSLRCKGTTYLGVLLGKYAQKFLEIV